MSRNRRVMPLQHVGNGPTGTYQPAIRGNIHIQRLSFQFSQLVFDIFRPYKRIAYAALL